MRESIQDVARQYARTFTIIQHAPRLPSAEEFARAKELTAADQQALDRAKLRRQQRADRKAAQVERAIDGLIKMVTLRWKCQCAYGAPYWQTLDIFESDECGAEIETEEHPDEVDQQLCSVECSRCHNILNQHDDSPEIVKPKGSQ